ncbi:DUF4143 domain-containing protein [Synechococcus sp. CS-205]|uniref:DUF4143 domain-containing protein n=1 Tax=Synechococcus sp. CS-205 TaxID=2847984 RepID=UPI00223B78F6|nr:DUF4143 domain-containing protein [Synechococcus sp. CS-205]MCT0249258.1 DUF4143 domain-containing protein [Synechococcus sp. CS-205]
MDLLLVRRLQPLHANVAKRHVKSAKVYVCESGLLHRLLGLDDRDAVYGHRVVGGSWEGFVVDLPGGQRWGIEVKRALAAKLGKGSAAFAASVMPTLPASWGKGAVDRRDQRGL